MKINKASLICFSPANHTLSICEQVKEELTVPTVLYDITAFQASCSTTYSKDELVFFAVPSFGGRVPEIALEKLKKCKGEQTPCVLIVTYGNRDYDDTLLELKEVVEGCGFITIGACALICEHSIMHVFGTDRPDSADRIGISNFLTQLFVKLQTTIISPIEVKGNHPYKEYHGIPLKPKVNASCTACGQCSYQCPVQAIDFHHPDTTDTSLCISCMRCITICPNHARDVNTLMVKASIMKMKKACSQPKQNEFIL